jgi:two-component system phosphate regulon response regulator PhoB
VTKHFQSTKLVLRVSFHLSQNEDASRATESHQIGDLLIDVERHQVEVKKKSIHLTSTEFRLLLELASKRGRVLTREHLLDKVWGYTYEGYARTVDTHVRRLREKLGPHSDDIETLRGVGYRFREETQR